MKYAFILIALTTLSCQAQKNPKMNESNYKPEIVKTDQEWRETLSEEEFNVSRKGGTERAFTGKYYKHDETGVYNCVSCDNPLFSSDTKYESGSGWPSYFKPYNENSIREVFDKSLGMMRTEVRCAKCDGHLGHVFNDGPQPTGMRYCVNSASLDFMKK